MVRTPFGINLDGLGAAINGFDDLRDGLAGRSVWVVGSNVEYAITLEFGASNHPPYPWLRPAVRDVMATQADAIVDESDSVAEMTKRLAFAIERQAKINVDANNERFGGDRSPGTDPDHPQVQTGNLINSITAERVR